MYIYIQSTGFENSFNHGVSLVSKDKTNNNNNNNEFICIAYFSSICQAQSGLQSISEKAVK